MKYTAFFIALIATTLFSTSLQAHTDDPALAAAQTAIDHFFNKNLEAYAASFSEEGELVNPLGMRMHGPDEIIAAHQPYFAQIQHLTMNKAITRESVRYLNDQIALVSLNVDTWATVEGEDSERKANTVLITLSQVNGQWLIDHFQVTPVLPMEEG